MSESDRESLEPSLEWILREARRPVALSADLRARIVREVRALPLPVQRRRMLRWFTMPRAFRLAPLTGALLAAGLVGIGVLGGYALTRNARTQTASPTEVAAAGVVVHEFVLHAPAATRVSLVGDFNDWRATAAPMTRASDGTWKVRVELPAGLHRYSFEVDGGSGETFVADPAAMRAPDDGFGPSSLVLVGQGATT